MKKNSLRMAVLSGLMASACSLLLLGCSSGGGGSDAAEDLSGTWFKVFPDPYFDYDGASSPSVAETMIMDVSGSSYQLVLHVFLSRVDRAERP